MRHLIKIFVLLMIPTCLWAQVNAYFNQNPKSLYTEPYRGITRPGDNLEEILLNEIAQAEKFIYIAVQEIRLPKLAKLLVQKKLAGVDVRIVLEHDYNSTILNQKDAPEGEYEASKLSELWAFIDTNRDGKIDPTELDERDAVHILRQGNVPTIDDTFDQSSGSGLMHHKFVIIDGKKTIVSTANFTMSCIHGDILSPMSRGNANSMVVVQSGIFSKVFIEEFRQLWGNGKRGNFGQRKTYRGPQTLTVKGIKMTIQFSPTSQKYKWEESVNGLIGHEIKTASRSVEAALFVFSDQNLADVLKAKRENEDLMVGAIIEPKFGYRDYSELLDLLGLQMLNSKCQYEAGNNPWSVPAQVAGLGILPRGDVLHHKFAVIDRSKVVMGSQNWSDSANYINDETLVVIEDTRISDLYGQEFDRLKKNYQEGPTGRLLKEIEKSENVCSRSGF